MLYLKMAKKGLDMYPDNPYYHYYVSNLYIPMRDNVTGLHYAEQGLERFPHHAGLLHMRANHLYHLIGESDEDTKKYIDANPFLMIIGKCPRFII